MDKDKIFCEYPLCRNVATAHGTVSFDDEIRDKNGPIEVHVCGLHEGLIVPARYLWAEV